MDPPGFALESFDPIGRFRINYENKRDVETNGVYLGKSFKDIGGFKKLLMGQDRIFARNLIIKIAEYAKGRKLVIADLTIVEKILNRVSYNDYVFKDMLEGIMMSELMTHR